jgi:hypothetical protein
MPYLDFPAWGKKRLIKFGKRLLNSTYEKSVNLAVLGELGQLPSIVYNNYIYI